MSAQGKADKGAKQRAVAVAILDCIERDGLLGVTHSKVARKSRVSRAWIYEYVGKEKESLTEYAAEFLALEFSRVSLREFPVTKSELEIRLRDGIDFLLNSVALSPVVIQLYFRYRGTRNPIGRTIKKYEDLWLHSASKTLTDVLGFPPDQALKVADFVLSMRMGLAHHIMTSEYPDLAQGQAKDLLNQIHKMLLN